MAEYRKDRQGALRGLVVAAPLKEHDRRARLVHGVHLSAASWSRPR